MNTTSNWIIALHQQKPSNFKLAIMAQEIVIKTEKQYEDNMIAVFELQEKEELTADDLKQIELMLKAGEKYEAEHL